MLFHFNTSVNTKDVTLFIKLSELNDLFETEINLETNMFVNQEYKMKLTL